MRRYVVFQIAEVEVQKNLFAGIFRMTAEPRLPPLTSIP